MLDQEHMDALRSALHKQRPREPDPPDPARERSIKKFDQDRRDLLFTDFFIQLETN